LAHAGAYNPKHTPGFLRRFCTLFYTILFKDVVTTPGGLECQGGDRVFLRDELEKANKNGGNTAACGLLNAHSQSKQHKAGNSTPSSLSSGPLVVSPSHHLHHGWRLRQRQQWQVTWEHQQGQADR